MFNKYLSFILKVFSLFIPLPLGLLLLASMPYSSTSSVYWSKHLSARYSRTTYPIYLYFFSAFDSAAIKKRLCRKDWEFFGNNEILRIVQPVFWVKVAMLCI